MNISTFFPSPFSPTSSINICFDFYLWHAAIPQAMQCTDMDWRTFMTKWKPVLARDRLLLRLTPTHATSQRSPSWTVMAPAWFFFFLSVTASLGSDFLSLCAAESRAWEHVVYSFAWICVHVHSTGTVLSLRSEMRERVDGENGLLCRHFVVRYAAVTLAQWDLFAEH